MTDFLSRYGNEPLDGKYKLIQRLGAGGMGEVYKGEHVLLGATRVIKIIRPQISDNVEAHDRFLREARLATKVHHQNVATLHDFAALGDGAHYMVWEFIDGENLAQMLRRVGPLPPRQAIRLSVEALSGLEAIHRAGIVHRDISPENIMVTHEDGGDHVKIIDLGVAKADEGDQQYTRTGMFVGKLRYASPEHLGFLPEGEKLDGRADLYSLAIVIYEMLTGRAPFEATSPHQYYIRYSREEALVPLDLTAVPGGAQLQAVLARALDRDRNRRFANAREFADALQNAAQSIPDASEMKTMSLPAADATMRLSESPFRTTQRSDYPAGTAASDKTVSTTPLPATQATPMPAPAAPQSQLPATQITPMPQPGPQPGFPGYGPQAGAAAAPQSIAPARGRSKALPLILAIAVILMLSAAGLIGYLALWPAWSARRAAAGQTTTTTVTSAAMLQSTQTGRPSQTSVDVVPPTTTTAATTTQATITPLTTTTAAPPPPPPTSTANLTRIEPTRTAKVVPTQTQPVQESEEPPAEEPAQEESTPAPNQSIKWTYMDGHAADTSGNDAAMSYARGQLAGVTKVAITGSGDAALRSQLGQLLQARGLAVGDSADTTIKFYGKLERNTLGRKRRFGDALIYRKGKLVFHYTLPLEEYRVGDNPAEAFARVAGDVFGR